MPDTGTDRANGFPLLITPRLVLRQLDANDAETLARFMGDRRVHRHLAQAVAHTTLEALDHIRSIRGAFLARQAVVWGIELRRSNTLIGTCGLYALTADNDHAEVSMYLDPEHWGRGYPLEIAAFVHAHARYELGLKHLHALVAPGNRAALNALRRSGYHSSVPVAPIDPSARDSEPGTLRFTRSDGSAHGTLST